MRTHVSYVLVPPAEGSRNNDPPVAMNLLSPKSWFLNSIPLYDEPGLLGEMADSGAGWDQWGWNIFFVPESTEVQKEAPPKDGDLSKGIATCQMRNDLSASMNDRMSKSPLNEIRT